ncbi:unnamed protein product [Rotaria sp. Silwood1]|nr:unnamed protein product [Rotaria sp. Silwood1]CAF1000764.1 unnamed protein product [Rotaria sp. Silwood1]CAF1009683.1 unnamed protein product [Rotaria sp. Silwood1]CAF3386485.1 unnamed protein product [Rotaria sp. Silwood1]CAF3410701.1 unnamed protein product [Rotaria sp. Silwood1]
MESPTNQTFLTTLPDEKQVKSITLNEYEDDIDIDVKSSADSEDTPIANDEIEEILNNKQSQEISSILIPTTVNDNLQDKMSHNDPSPSAVSEHLQTIIPRAVFDYAAIVHEKLESPRQTKLDHDVNAVLGSSDPPPGFGFLHPRFYYLEQKRPVPMEPLRVRIYFIPFHSYLSLIVNMLNE